MAPKGSRVIKTAQKSRERFPFSPRDLGSISQRNKTYPLTVYFDGDCPICRREIVLMKLLNSKNRLSFVDFSLSSYRPNEHGLSRCDLERIIHARWADGTLVTGVEVFREMWEAIGAGFLARLSRWPLINTLMVKAYAWFARNRLRLTSRANTHRA